MFGSRGQKESSKFWRQGGAGRVAKVRGESLPFKP